MEWVGGLHTPMSMGQSVSPNAREIHIHGSYLRLSLILGSLLRSLAYARSGPQDRHVVCVHDNGGLFEMYVRHMPEGGFMFMSREFDKLQDIVKHLQRNPLYNKQGEAHGHG